MKTTFESSTLRDQFEKKSSTGLVSPLEIMTRQDEEAKEKAKKKAEQEALQPPPFEYKELNEENINSVKTLSELRTLLRWSVGMDIPSEGHLNGEDLIKVMDQIGEKKIYIEQMTAENGLRDKLWDLMVKEKGIEPNSMDREDEEVIKSTLIRDALDYEALKESHMPTTQLLPTENKTPTKPILDIFPKKKSMFAKTKDAFKRLFGF